jgi:hypothetical protein
MAEENKFLYHPILGKRSFKAADADRVLNMEKNGGWVPYSGQDKGKTGENAAGTKRPTKPAEKAAKTDSDK